MTIHNPAAPEKEAARYNALRLAQRIEAETGFTVGVQEAISGWFEIVIRVPYRREINDWLDRTPEESG